jgi:hypothetical protein
VKDEENETAQVEVPPQEPAAHTPESPINEP